MQTTGKMALAEVEGAPAKRRHVKQRKRQLVILACVYVGLAGLVLLARGLSELKSREISRSHASHQRSLTKRSTNNGSRFGLHATAEDPENCTPRAIYEFPGDFFTLYETQHGGVVIHILIALYMFCSLAIVCDDYFVASLEMICDRLGLQEDVAGATFMAAGSSAPELFTSVIGVFIAQSDVGVGTIVGSAVFNILFIIAICALFSGMVVTLTWWPMTRDCVVYLLSVVCLIVVMNDGLIYWYEAVVMLVLYILYILIMYFNRRLEGYFTEKAKGIKFKCLRCSHEEAKEKNPLLNKLNGALPNGTNPNGTVSNGAPPNGTSPNGSTATDPTESLTSNSSEQETQLGSSTEATQNEKTHAHEEYDSPWDIPEGFLARVFWVAMVPVKAILFVTIPDCRWPGVWQKLYPATFIASIVWIAGFSYLMVWMVTIAGDALGIPDTVMGLTFLAAGTSVPDALSSLFVSRDGLGDMAVSNSIGSNVFDILMCLGLPWFLKTVAVDTGKPVAIASHGLLFSAITLLTTVAFVLIATHLSRWRLTKWVGILFLVVYVIVITFSCLYELNVFGDLNLPMCPRR